MAFGSTVTIRTILGDKRWHCGTWTGDADGEGDIDTGLRSCEIMFLTIHGASGTSTPVVYENLPATGSAITINSGAATNGYWLAIGY